MEKISKYIFSFFFMPLLFIFLKGYLFGTGDQGELLLPIYKLINPELYNNDYFVTAYFKTGFTVRFYYDYLLYFGSYLMSLEWFCFLLTIFSVGFSSFYIYSITEQIKGRHLSLFLAPIFALVLFYDFTLGSNYLQYNHFLPSSLAKAFIIGSIYYYLKQSFIKTSVMIGIAALLHPLAAIQVFIIFFILEIIRKYFTMINFKSLIRITVPFALISSFILLPIFINLAVQSNININTKEYYDILYTFRLPHHFNPLLFSLTSYIKFAILTALSIYLLPSINTKYYANIMLFVISILVGLFIYTILFSVLGLKTIGITQWFKTTIWISLFSSVILAIKAELIYNKLTQRIKALTFNYNLAFILVSLTPFIFLGFITNTIGKPEFNKRYYINNLYKNDDLFEVHQWINKNSSLQSTFITFPSDFGFASQAKRSLITGYKAILIHNKTFIPKWYAVYSKIYSTSIDSLKENPNLLELSEANYYQYLKNKEELKQRNVMFRLFDSSKTDYIPEKQNVVYSKGMYVIERIN